MKLQKIISTIKPVTVEKHLAACTGCGVPFQEQFPDKGGYLPNIQAAQLKWVEKQSSAEAAMNRTDLDRAQLMYDMYFKNREWTETDKRKMIERARLSVGEASKFCTELQKLKKIVDANGLDEVAKQKYSELKKQLALKRTDTSVPVTGDDPSTISLENIDKNEFLAPMCGEIRSVQKKPEDYPLLVCMRCYWLKNHRATNAVPSVSEHWWPSKVVEFVQKQMAVPRSHVILVVDILDIPGSIPQGFYNIFERETPIILVGTKIDCLPKEVPYEEAKLWLKDQVKECGYRNIVKTVLISSYTETNIKSLEEILMARLKLEFSNIRGNAMIVGMVNVGKSSLWNRLMKYLNGQMNVTCSPYPGTTVGFLRATIPGNGKNGFIFDSPGIPNCHSIWNQLTLREMLKLTMYARTKPKLWLVRPGQTLFLGGLARLDYEGNKEIFVTLSTPKIIQGHLIKTEHAEEEYKKHASIHERLRPPFGGEARMANFPPLQVSLVIEDLSLESMKEYYVEYSISGLGYFGISGHASVKGKVTVWTVGKVPVFERPALFPGAPYCLRLKYKTLQNRKYYMKQNNSNNKEE